MILKPKTEIFNFKILKPETEIYNTLKFKIKTTLSNIIAYLDMQILMTNLEFNNIIYSKYYKRSQAKKNMHIFNMYILNL